MSEPPTRKTKAGRNILRLKVRQFFKHLGWVKPLASRSKTSVTRMRMPRIHSRPPHCCGSTVIRSASLGMKVNLFTYPEHKPLRGLFRKNTFPLRIRLCNPLTGVSCWMDKVLKNKDFILFISDMVIDSPFLQVDKAAHFPYFFPLRIDNEKNGGLMSSILRSVVLQKKAEEALAQERLEARISALQDLRFELCRIVDELIAREEQTVNLDSNDFEEL